MPKDLDLKILPPDFRISPKQLHDIIEDQRHLLVDVRSEAEFQMCKLDGSTNFPIEKLTQNKVNDLVDKVKSGNIVTFVCRRGNDSQIVAKKILDQLDPAYHSYVKDLIGGLHAWSKDVDHDFPIY